MKPVAKSSKLANVCYDIRGPVLDRAKQMEEEGHKIIKLNIGNLAVFGLEPPDEIVQDMIRNLANAAGYTDSKGLFAPRKSIVHYTQQKHVAGVTVDDVYLGNGVSELIAMSLQALLDNGDEVLVPAPDYPLWTASVTLSGGTAVHYMCDEQSDWNPDLDDIRSKITPRTKAIVIINPNNPTGALYPDDVLQGIVQIAREHQLIVMADEIYDKTLYDGNQHTSIASLADDVLFVTFNGLSKNYRSCGYRAGWMVVSGDKRHHFTIEFADNDERRMTGLMFRPRMAADAGMLFDFKRDAPVSMWMKNTLIPLDMLFIGRDGRVAVAVAG